MSGVSERYQDVDTNIAVNVRAYREARGLAQEDLAQQLAGAGFGFSQATIWKIESRQRPVRAAELVALADALGVRSAISLTWQPDAERRRIGLQQAAATAASTYTALKDAATAYLEAQIELVVMAHEAREAGLAVTELDTSWLTVMAEEAVIEARVDSEDAATRSGHLNDEAGKILTALRANGYQPHLSIDDVTTEGGGNFPGSLPGDARA